MSTFLEGGGASVSAQDLVLEVKLGDAMDLALGVLRRRMAVQRAEAEGLEVGEDDLDEAVSRWCAERDLFEEAQVKAFLAERRLSPEDLRRHVRDEELVGALRARLVPDERVEEQFGRSLHDYAVAKAERIQLPSVGAAAELVLEVREGEITWERACQRAGGVEVVELRRRDAGAELGPHLFAAQPLALVGPVERDDEDSWDVYRLLSRHVRQLDDELKEEIRSELFEEILLRPLAKAPPRFS